MVPSNFDQWLESRARQRAAKLRSRLASISGVRDAPAREDILIGSAAQTRAVVLFVDVVASTKLAIKYSRAPENMLATLNLLIPTLQDVVYYHEGGVEKNTGDGLLAYFGVGSEATDQDAARLALLAAVRMMDATSTLVNALLAQRHLEKVAITIGADLGDVLIARIGIQRQESPLVAVGVAANRAAKIQQSAQPGQIRIGEDVYQAVPSDHRKVFKRVSVPRGWPFTVPKSEAALSLERMHADLEASQADQAAKLADPRSWLSHLIYTPGLPQVPPLPTPVAPVIPRFVDPMRPYGIYAFNRRWA